MIRIGLFLGICMGCAFPFTMKAKENASSGSLIVIPIHFSERERLGDLRIEGKQEQIHTYKKRQYLFIATDVQYFPKEVDVAVVTSRKIYQKAIHIVPRKVSIGFVNLSGQNKTLRLANKRMADENNFFHGIFLVKRESFTLKTPFKIPLEGEYRVSSDYGKKRVYTGNRVSFHRGTDLVPGKDKDVYASNDGEVVFAGKKPVRGNLVILYHGDDLYTSYWHLSQVVAKVGEVVHRGQKIGVVGTTGLASGAHLHWEARYKGVTFEPRDLLNIQI